MILSVHVGDPSWESVLNHDDDDDDDEEEEEEDNE